MHDEDNFFSRWSRRKVQARSHAERPVAPDQSVAQAASATIVPVSEATDQPSVESASQPRAASGLQQAPEPGQGEHPLPSLDSLRGLDSEYSEFLKPEVAEDTKRAALRKLFADPHFNQMDGLDVYIDDYGKFEPMPAAVATSLAAFHRLSVFDHLASEQAKADERGEQQQAGDDSRVAGEDPVREAEVPGGAHAGIGIPQVEVGVPRAEVGNPHIEVRDTHAETGATKNSE